MGDRVLLVGATSAIATATARLLAARGDRLYLVARSSSKLEAVAAELGDAVVGTEACDLTDLEALPGIVARGFEALGHVDTVLIGHGWLPDQLETERDARVADATFQVNLLSVVHLLVPIANRLEEAGAGRIGVITSVAGMRGRPRNYTYGAAKSALSTYLQGLRSRLYGTGVTVHDLRPGPVITPMTEGHPVNPLFATPERVAGGIVAALDGRWSVRYLPWYWWPIMQIVTRLPEPVFQQFGFLAGR